jgi:transposase
MPGSGKQSADVQQQIIEFLEAGIDPTTIHRRLKVGRSSIYRMKRSLQQHGTAYAPPETNKKNGRPKVLSAEQEQVGLYLVACLLQCCSTDNTSTS